MSPLSGPVIIDYLASLGFAVPLKESCVNVPHSPQVYDVFPALEPLYFQFEKDFDPTCLPDLYEMYWYGCACYFRPHDPHYTHPDSDPDPNSDAP
jgi:hypothetical protein